MGPRGVSIAAPTCLRFYGTVVVVAAFFLVGATTASAAPIWQLGVHRLPTNFASTGTDEYGIAVVNLGDTASSGQTTLTVLLPPGFGRASVSTQGSPGWECPGAPGDTTITCSTTDSIPRHSIARNLVLGIYVAAGVSGARVVRAEVAGGGAAESAEVAATTPVSSQPATFGVVNGSFLADSFSADGATPVRSAGAHPDQFTVRADFNTLTAPEKSGSEITTAGNIRDLEIALPPGFLGNPTAVGQCSPGQLTTGTCPIDSQVGRVDLATGPVSLGALPEVRSVPLFNMEAPRGAVADLAFIASGNPVHFRLSLDPANGYSLLVRASDLNESLPLFDMELTLWGVPGAPSHDSERCHLPDTNSECSTDLEPRPFLTDTSECGVKQAISMRGYDSWEDPGVFGPTVDYPLPGPIAECDRARFEPVLEVAPTVTHAETPTGLDVRLLLPQDENPAEPATPPIRDFRLRLPQGMAISPAGAEGLTGCSSVQIALGTDAPAVCPESSRIGEVQLNTPLLPQPLKGSVYLATPDDNPSLSTFAVYVVARDTEDRGVLIKIPGRLELDPESGDVSVVFESLPQLPFEELDLRFRSGPHALFTSSPTCGAQQIDAAVSSWADPGRPVPLTDTYRLEEGADGGGCASPGQRTFAPTFSAGTLDPTAASSTPFVLELGQVAYGQGLGALDLTLPPGLNASEAGIARCSAATVAAITNGDSPCPAASRVGSVTVLAGAGPEPLRLRGDVYLAGPYQGAPYSMVFAVPAIAGPFDLGTIVQQVALSVDPGTAQLGIHSGSLPRIVEGVPLGLRGLDLDLDRGGLIRNPTSCEPMVIVGRATSGLGQTAHISSRFQVGECGRLKFKPKLALRLSGATGRNGHPALRASFRTDPDGASLQSANFALPAGELLDLEHVRKLCPPEGAVASCPPGSRLGSIRLYSPSLEGPLKGSVYLRVPSHRLPELIGKVRSGGLEVVLHGHVTNSKGRLGVTLEALPDLPLARAVLSLAGGRRAILVNSRSLCGKRTYARARFGAHNGRTRRLQVPIRVSGCH
jgi:hypothetical protein